MMVFTRKDIQTDIFEVDGYLGNEKVQSLETYLFDLEEADCYVVDITLLETKQSGLGNYSKYLIRFVAPKYEVRIERRTWDDVRFTWNSTSLPIERFFDRLDEAEDYRKKALQTEDTITDIITHSPLDLPL